MRNGLRVTGFAAVVMMAAGLAVGQTQPAATRPGAAGMGRPAPINPALPTIWLVGDSTVNNNANGGLGWGTPFAKLFDLTKVNVVNQARGGRSARSYISEGLWDGPNGVLARVKAGDVVLIQFGHNDAGGTAEVVQKETKGRADLAGIGDETTTATSSTGKEETVHTYGWYLKKYVEDAKGKGALPIVLTMVPHNRFEGDKMRRNTNTFTKWAKEVAEKGGVPLVDLNEISARRMEKEGAGEVKTKYFTPPGDGTHTNPAGAGMNAESVVMGLRALGGLKVEGWLSESGKGLEKAAEKEVVEPKP